MFPCGEKGEEWTRFHLPPHDREGNKSEKWNLQKENWRSEKWINWRNSIWEKLRSASEYYSGETDNRAQFQGVCFPAYFDFSINHPENETTNHKPAIKLYLNALWSRFDNTLDIRNFRFGGRTKFQHASFGGLVDFKHTRFDMETFFEAAKFDGGVSFQDSVFTGAVSFNNAKFAAMAKFHGCTFHQDTSFADAKFDIPVLKLNLFKDIWRTVTSKHEAEDAEAYESAFRVLRQHMENLRNHEQEMKFGSLEMQARERRYGSPDVRLLVRILSRGYGFISDYGQSIWQPFLGLFLAPIFAAVLYAGLGGGKEYFLDALAFAFQYSLPPISMAISGFFEPNIDGTFTNVLLAKPFFTGLVMTVHGISSLVMLFFLLLALKRRFQIR